MPVGPAEAPLPPECVLVPNLWPFPQVCQGFEPIVQKTEQRGVKRKGFDNDGASITRRHRYWLQRGWMDRKKVGLRLCVALERGSSGVGPSPRPIRPLARCGCKRSVEMSTLRLQPQLAKGLGPCSRRARKVRAHRSLGCERRSTGILAGSGRADLCLTDHYRLSPTCPVSW